MHLFHRHLPTDANCDLPSVLPNFHLHAIELRVIVESDHQDFPDSEVDFREHVEGGLLNIFDRCEGIETLFVQSIFLGYPFCGLLSHFPNFFHRLTILAIRFLIRIHLIAFLLKFNHVLLDIRYKFLPYQLLLGYFLVLDAALGSMEH